jgi:hypothetical protein
MAIITHGVSFIAFRSLADILASDDLSGNVRETKSKKRYAAQAIPIPIPIFRGVEGSFPFFLRDHNSHITTGVKTTTRMD